MPHSSFSFLEGLKTLNLIGIHRYAKALAVATFILIIAGGLVTSTGSGLSVPDWPLSYGRFFPPMIGGILYEHSHRIIAGTVAVLTLILAVLACRSPVSKSVRTLSLTALGLVILQALLGGVTVLFHLPLFVSVAHACIAQIFFCLIITLTLISSPLWGQITPEEAEGSQKFQRLCLSALILIFLQIFSGAFVRHSSNITALTFHVINVILIALHVFLIITNSITHFSRFKTILIPSLLLVHFLLIQSLLGTATFVFTRLLENNPEIFLGAVIFRTAHQTTGALMLAASLILTLWSHRQFKFIEPTLAVWSKGVVHEN